MIQKDRMLSLNEKIQLVARDMYDTALIKDSLKLKSFIPSKQIQNIISSNEFEDVVEFLKKRKIVYAFRSFSNKLHSSNSHKNQFIEYDLTIYQPEMRRLLGLENMPSKQIDRGIKLDKDFSKLIINGITIPLGKGKLHKSLQYWICYLCLKCPNTPVEETDIMAKYATDYEVNARSRAIRDAVYRLNPKIQKVTGIDELFTYSSGYVVFNADKLK